MAGIVNRKTIQIGDATITVRSSSAWTMTDAETVRIKIIRSLGKEITEGDRTFYRITDIEAARLGEFVLMLVNTESVKGSLGFEWPLPSASAEELIKAFREIGDCLDLAQLAEWVEALKAVDQPPGDPDLFPGGPEGEESSRKSK